jgi:hypothetical protein
MSAQSAGGGGGWLEPSTGSTPGSTTDRWCAAAALKQTARRHSSPATHSLRLTVLGDSQDPFFFSRARHFTHLGHF